MKTKIQGLERLSEFWKISSKVVRGLGPDPKTLNKPRPPPPSGCFLEDLVFLLRAALWNLGLAHHLGPRALLQVCSKAEPFTVTKSLAKHFKRKKGLFGLVVLEGFPTSWCGRCDGKTAAPILVGLPVTWHSREREWMLWPPAFCLPFLFGRTLCWSYIFGYRADFRALILVLQSTFRFVSTFFS